MTIILAHTVWTVARRLVLIGAPDGDRDDSDAVYLSPLHLQKLLYYCQGWSLALLGRPLFVEPLLAWKFGPVVATVHGHFRGQSGGIVPTQLPPSVENLSGTEGALIDMVWREYGRVTPSELVAMTHAEPAWREARAGLPADSPSDAVINLATMRDHFRAEARRRGLGRPGYPVLDATEVWAAEEAFEQSGCVTVPAAEFFAGLMEGR